MNVILGAGLSGLACSYHLGHEHCTLLESAGRAFGHVHSTIESGFTWDEGPHVSFTKHEYVRQLFARSVCGEFDEYPVRTVNYYKGHWIDHPAQSNLYQVPEPLRSRCLEAFLKSRASVSESPQNYAAWLEAAFGKVFADSFPAAYTRKYWTVEPSEMTTDWVGARVFQPNISDVVAGANGPLERQTHYITQVRYPRQGGYQSFARLLAQGANVRLNSNIVCVDLEASRIHLGDNSSVEFDRLISTIPLPTLIGLCLDAPDNVRVAAADLNCTQLLLVNVTAPHPTQRSENWFYVYDEDKVSTRIHCVERLTEGNAPAGHTGIQVEVYFSRSKPMKTVPTQIAAAVVEELIEMGFINPALLSGPDAIGVKTRMVPWANVVCDHARRPALDTILEWLSERGLKREPDDLEPMTDWDAMSTLDLGSVILAGRFAQWKYFWTDDCVMRGRSVGQALNRR